MALAATKVSEITMGNKKAQIYSLAFTSVTGGLIKTGLAHVEFASYSPTTSDDHGIVYRNSTTASETADDGGDVYVDDVTSNDNGQLFVIGA